MRKILLPIVFDPFYLVFVFFFVVITLYGLSFSNLYKCNFLYLVYLYSFVFLILFFGVCLTSTKLVLHKVRALSVTIEAKNSACWAVLIFFTMGTIANLYEYTVVGWPIFLENKVNRGQVIHYVHYITNFLMYSMAMSYFLCRNFVGFKRFVFALVFIFSFMQLFVWLNRGFITLTIVFAAFYEILLAYRKRELNFMMVKMSIILVLFIVFFGYLGDMRVAYVMENVYGHTINFHYGMPEIVPSSFVWVYMYSTSSFENFRHMLVNQEIENFRYGLLMVYPFVAPIFKQIFEKKVDTYPYLDSVAGLNVSSFLESAYNDFGVFGAYIYVVFLTLLFLIALKFIARGVFGLLVFSSIVNIALWMIFVNGFSIGPFVIGTIFFILLSLVFERPTGSVTVVIHRLKAGGKRWRVGKQVL